MRYAFLKIAQFSLHFSSSLHQFKTITLSQEKQPSPGWISLKFGTIIRHIMAYPHLTFEDKFEGAMNDYIAKNDSKALVVPTA